MGNWRLDPGLGPGRLIDVVEAGQVEMESSATLLAELHGVLSREKFAKQLGKRGITVADAFYGIAAMVNIVTPATIAPTITRDLADCQVLAAALASRADLIVSGDAQLLDLKSFQVIEIVIAAVAVQRIAAGA